MEHYGKHTTDALRSPRVVSSSMAIQSSARRRPPRSVALQQPQIVANNAALAGKAAVAPVDCWPRRSV